MHLGLYLTQSHSMPPTHSDRHSGSTRIQLSVRTAGRLAGHFRYAVSSECWLKRRRCRHRTKMGCVSSKSKNADREPPYGVPVTSPGTEKSGARDGGARSEGDVGYDITRETVKVSRDSGDAQVCSKTSSTSSIERRRSAQQSTSSDVTDQPPSHAVSACLHRADSLVRSGTDLTYTYIKALLKWWHNASISQWRNGKWNPSVMNSTSPNFDTVN